MYIFGINIPILELLILLTLVVLVYLILLEFHFRTFRRLLGLLEKDESKLGRLEKRFEIVERALEKLAKSKKSRKK